MYGYGRAMLKRMFEWGLSPDIITYSALIKGFCDLGQIEDAQRLVDEMTEHGFTPNVVTYTILLNGAYKDRSLESLFIPRSFNCCFHRSLQFVPLLLWLQNFILVLEFIE